MTPAVSKRDPHPLPILSGSVFSICLPGIPQHLDRISHFQIPFKIPNALKLAGALPPGIDTLRIVEIEGIDVQADGGTHVKNTKEVGKIELISMDNKGKDNRRIYFRLV